jgi:hypothetical protein
MEKIRDMIVDDIRLAQQRQDKAHVVTLLHVLHHFLKSHPEVCPPQSPGPPFSPAGRGAWTGVSVSEQMLA